MVEGAGASAIAVHGRTAAQSYSGDSDWALIARVAAAIKIPVFGSGDCIEPGQVVSRLGNNSVGGVLVGRGALRNPWIFRQAAELAAGRQPAPVGLEERGQFLLDYIDLLLNERVNELAGFRHVAPGERPDALPARGRAKWVVNKLRALNSWYTKGLNGGSHLRTSINSADSIDQLRSIIVDFFVINPKTVNIDDRCPVAVLPE